MRIVSIVHPAGHEMPMLLDGDGLPIPDPNEWLIGRRSLAPTTQSRLLSELVPLYGWAGVHPRFHGHLREGRSRP